MVGGGEEGGFRAFWEEMLVGILMGLEAGYPGLGREGCWIVWMRGCFRTLVYCARVGVYSYGCNEKTQLVGHA